MRRIFIDGGANRGQSRSAFLRQWPNSEEFDIHMFEPDSNLFRNLSVSLSSDKKTTVHNEAVWVRDGEISFYRKFPGSEANTIFKEKAENQKWRNIEEVRVRCVDISRWLKENTKQDDYIILKIDIEGAEYEVIEHLHVNGAFDRIDILFLEMHGPKCNKTLKESTKLIETISKNNLKPYFWEAKKFKYSEYEKNFYDIAALKKEYEQYEKENL